MSIHCEKLQTTINMLNVGNLVFFLDSSFFKHVQIQINPISKFKLYIRQH